MISYRASFQHTYPKRATYGVVPCVDYRRSYTESLPESAEVSRMPPKSKKCLCSICEKEVVDQDGQRKGQDAIFCEGNCQEWLHRVCTGLPNKVFLEVYKESDVPFYCPYCTYQRQEKEITTLKSTIDVLQLELTELRSSSNTNTIAVTEEPSQPS